MRTDGPFRHVVAITGASGSIYGRRAVQALVELGSEVHVVVSDAGRATWAYELGGAFDPAALQGPVDGPGRVVMHSNDDLFAGPASGSFRHGGMLVAPCSVKTLAAVASGMADNLVNRAADCCLKERRPLVLLVRESPLSAIHLENMLRAHRAGAVIDPASPAFYTRPSTLDDLVDFVVGRALDQLGVAHNIGRRWKDQD